MIGVIITGVSLVLTFAAYFDRANLKADITKFETALLSKAEVVATALKVREASVRTTIAADVTKVIAAAKADAAKADAKADAIVASIEAEIKKVI